MRRVLALVAVAACGSDGAPLATDSGLPPVTPGTPAVVVTTPRLNEAFYPNQSATITWVATDDEGAATTCTVRAATDQVIAADVAAASGATVTASWSLASITPGMYVAEVTCTDPGGLAGVGRSAPFSVSEPPVQVSYATQVQPIWNASCSSNACHDANQPAGTLDLTAARSHAQLVDVTSADCPTKRVQPGAPDQSYLVHKLQGSGPCLMGSRMPKGAQALSAAQMKIVRDWIANGAPNN